MLALVFFRLSFSQEKRKENRSNILSPIPVRVHKRILELFVHREEEFIYFDVASGKS